MLFLFLGLSVSILMWLLMVWFGLVMLLLLSCRLLCMLLYLLLFSSCLLDLGHFLNCLVKGIMNCNLLILLFLGNFLLQSVHSANADFTAFVFDISEWWQGIAGNVISHLTALQGAAYSRLQRWLLLELLDLSSKVLEFAGFAGVNFLLCLLNACSHILITIIEVKVVHSLLLEEGGLLLIDLTELGIAKFALVGWVFLFLNIDCWDLPKKSRYN